MLFSPLAAVSSIILSTTIASEPLWQELPAGASEVEVSAAYPAARFDTLGSRDGKRIYRLEAFPAEGMWVNFTFTDGLSQVDVHGQGRANYMSVVEALVQKYGPIIQQSQLAGNNTSIWAKDGLTVTAVFRDRLDAGGGFYVDEAFEVRYQRASHRDLKQGL